MSGLGLSMGQFRQFLMELSARHTSVVSFWADNFSKYQSIFTKLDICIDIVEIWFGIANVQISSSFFKLACTKVQGAIGVVSPWRWRHTLKFYDKVFFKPSSLNNYSPEPFGVWNIIL